MVTILLQGRQMLQGVSLVCSGTEAPGLASVGLVMLGVTLPLSADWFGNVLPVDWPDRGAGFLLS